MVNSIAKAACILYYMGEIVKTWRKILKKMAYDINHLSDEELMMLIKYEDQDPYTVLFNRYEPICRKFIHKYRLRHFDADDLRQEAWLVIMKSVHYFDNKRGYTFGQFLRRAVNNEFQNILRREEAIKRRIDKFACSLDYLTEEDADYFHHTGDLSSSSYLGGQIISPEDYMLTNELFKKFQESLSSFEYQVFQLYTQQIGRNEIADMLETERGKVDNAMERCRIKLRTLTRLKGKESSL